MARSHSPLVVVLGVAGVLFRGSSLDAAGDRNAAHIRPLMPGIHRLVDLGIERSLVFRALLERLDTSDVIVYIDCRALTVDPPPTNGQLSFLGRAGGRRFLSVHLMCPRSDQRQLPYLAHELQHAVEVADAPDVVDEASFLAHLEEHGYRTRLYCDEQHTFETEAAREVERRVRRDMAAMRATGTEP